MYKNSEGYRDPTAGEAIRAADKLPKHISECFTTFNHMAGLMGFDITKMEMKDRKTGRVWRK